MKIASPVFDLAEKCSKIKKIGNKSHNLTNQTSVVKLSPYFRGGECGVIWKRFCHLSTPFHLIRSFGCVLSTRLRHITCPFACFNLAKNRLIIVLINDPGEAEINLYPSSFFVVQNQQNTRIYTNMVATVESNSPNLSKWDRTMGENMELSTVRKNPLTAAPPRLKPSLIFEVLHERKRHGVRRRGHTACARRCTQKF